MLTTLTADMIHALQSIPGLAIFLSLAIGYAIGQIKIGPIQLGGVCGTLIAALLIGQLNIPVVPGLKNLFFMLFIFALGYSGGPQFFANLNAKGIQLGIFCLIEVVAVLTLVLTATMALNLDPGTAAGMMAGAATESAVVGTATDAIARLNIPSSEILRLQSNVVTAYSITYICGLITIVIVTSQLFPLFLRVNLRDEADKLWLKMGGRNNNEGVSAAPTVVGRVYLVNAGAGRTLREVHEKLDQQGNIIRVERHGRLVTLSPGLKLHRGDKVLVVGYRGSLINIQSSLGNESADTTSLSVALDTYNVVLLSSARVNQPLRTLPLPDNIHVASILRGDLTLPALPETLLQKQDILQIYDTRAFADRNSTTFLSGIGKLMPDRLTSSLGIAGLAIASGTILGSFTLKLGGIPFSAGTGGGVLIVGLIMGWYHSRRADLHTVNPQALSLLKDLGLAGFIAGVGLSSGPQALTLIMQYGLTLPLLGIAIAVIPAFISLMVGHFFLKLSPPILLGAIAGQQCSTPALSAIQNACGNSTPLLGYTITYAISNIILPLMGPLIVGLANSLQPS